MLVIPYIINYWHNYKAKKHFMLTLGAQEYCCSLGTKLFKSGPGTNSKVYGHYLWARHSYLYSSLNPYIYILYKNKNIKEKTKTFAL